MIDRLNAPALAVTDGVMGKTYTPSRSIEPVWGRLTGKHPNSNGPAHHFQWEQVFQDEDKEWQAVTDLHDVARGGYGSTVDGDDLFNPAVEINAHAVEIGTVVRLVPSRVVNETYQQLPHRLWVFSYQELRPFKFKADLIPTGGGELDTSIAAEWLDNPGETVTLYPEHRSGFPSGDTFFSLGIGRGPGAYFRGTYGWARYQPKATAYMAADGTQKWRGEWQIVTLYAELIAQAIVTDAEIDPGETASVRLWWINKHASPAAMIDSGYSVDMFNDLIAAIDVGAVLKIEFNRAMYVWTPLNTQPPCGITIRQSAGQNTTNAYVVLQLDVSMDSFGLYLERNGNTIKNIGNVPVIGVVSWQVCAQRYLLVQVPPDCDAIFHAMLYNNAVAITGTESRLSSSRRLVLNEGDRAVNTVSGSIVVKIEAGQAIDLRIKHSLSTEDTPPPPPGQDIYTTVGDNSHLTFHTIPNTILNP